MLQFVIITLLGGWTTKEGHWQTRLARHLADTLNLSVLAIDVTGRGESARSTTMQHCILYCPVRSCETHAIQSTHLWLWVVGVLVSPVHLAGKGSAMQIWEGECNANLKCWQARFDRCHRLTAGRLSQSTILITWLLCTGESCGIEEVPGFSQGKTAPV